MSLVELICPDCAASMPPRPGQAIHACASCGASWEAVAGHGLARVPRQLACPNVAPGARGTLHLLPVWCVAVHRDRLPGVGERMAAEIRVPATGIGRLALLVESARRLTRAAAPVREWTGVEAVGEGAEIDAETAFAVAEAVALRHVPGWPADEAVETVELPLGGARLVDWPCVAEGSELVELVGGLALPGALFGAGAPRDQRPVLGPALAALGIRPESTPTRSGS